MYDQNLNWTYSPEVSTGKSSNFPPINNNNKGDRNCRYGVSMVNPRCISALVIRNRRKGVETDNTGSSNCNLEVIRTCLNKFFSYYRMSVQTFYELLSIVRCRMIKHETQNNYYTFYFQKYHNEHP